MPSPSHNAFTVMQWWLIIVLVIYYNMIYFCPIFGSQKSHSKVLKSYPFPLPDTCQVDEHDAIYIQGQPDPSWVSNERMQVTEILTDFKEKLEARYCIKILEHVCPGQCRKII